MNAEIPAKIYGKAILFLLPALVMWLAARVFLFPRLEYLWAGTNLSLSAVHWPITTTTAIMRGEGVALIATLALSILTEWRFRASRRTIVGAAVFLLNSAAITGLSLMCLLSILLVPGPR
jgi:hypothetical protein